MPARQLLVAAFLQIAFLTPHAVRVLMGAVLLAFAAPAKGQPPTYLLQWGSTGAGPGQFNEPTGIAVDASGTSVYVADKDNSRAQKFDPTGVYQTHWSTGVASSPWSVAVGPDGSVYVADYIASQIRKYDANGAFITQWGSNGSADGQFSTVPGVAVSSDNFVYVADFNNRRVQKFTADGQFVLKWGSNGTGDGQFSQGPAAIDVDDDGNVYVLEYHRVQRFTSNGVFVLKWGSSGSGPGSFSTPRDLGTDALGNVYVADGLNHRVQKFTSSGTFLLSWGTQGSGDGQFNNVLSVDLDRNGGIYVADFNNDRIQKFTHPAAADCNDNGISDSLDIASSTSTDCNTNGIPDDCEAGLSDCNGNAVPDLCEIAGGAPDCDGNGVPDSCDVAGGTPDCDGDGIPNSCEILAGAPDCNGNGVPDSCDVAGGAPDCDGDGIPNSCEIAGGGPDCNGNGVPDSCDVAGGAPDCDGDGIPNSCEIAGGATDCDGDGVPNSCEIASGAPDCNANSVPDACEPDCDDDGIPDTCEGGGGWGSGLGIQPPLNLRVHTMVAKDSLLFCGGQFTGNVATWNGSVWSIVGTGIPQVEVLTIWNNQVVAIGGYGSVSLWTGAGWSPIASPGGQQMRKAVEFADDLVILDVSGAVHRWDGASWTPMGNVGLTGGALYVWNGDLYCGARRWTGTSWQSIGAHDGTVDDLIEYQGRLIAVGTFTTIDTVPASRIAAWNGTSWSAFGSGLADTLPLPNQSPPRGLALTTYNGQLVVTGRFTHVDGVAASGIAAWDGATWRPFGSGLAGGSPTLGLYPAGFDVCEFEGALHVGGSFLTAGGAPSPMLARWNGSSDCNLNGVPDSCEPDCDGDGIPNACEVSGDCNENGVADMCDIGTGASQDCDLNGVPDECQPDCDGDGIPNACESLADCDADGVPDHCELAAGLPDCDANGVPDACQRDSDHDGVIDICEIAGGAPDCNGNGVPDESDAYAGSYGFSGLEVGSAAYGVDLRTGDFDEDGWPDLAGAWGGYSSTHIGVAWNEQGTGWTWEYFYNGLLHPVTLAVGDFNGDGDLDLAWGIGFSVVYRLGTGTRALGSYGVKDFDLIQQAYNRMLALDVDRDEMTDLVWTRHGNQALGIVEGAALTGPGLEPGFLQIPLTTESAIQRIAVGYVSGDTIHDIIAQNNAFGTTPSGFYYLRATGNGSYEDPVHINAPMPVYALTCGDLNGDGRDDVVMEGGNATGRHMVTWLSNNAGGFNPPDTTHYAGMMPGPFDIALADFDRDGRLDAALKSGLLLLGMGNGKFRTPAHPWHSVTNWGWLSVLDYNRDGWPDLSNLSNWEDSFGIGSSISVLRNEIVPPGGSADANHDGIPDECQGLSASDRLVPLQTRLTPARPNPFRGGTSFALDLAHDSEVVVEIFDVTGARARGLVSGRLEAGTHELRWDGRTTAGADASPGIYFVRFRADGRGGGLKVLKLE